MLFLLPVMKSVSLFKKNPYIRLRFYLANFAIKNFINSFKSSSEILILVFGPGLLGLLACVALPTIYASTQPPLLALVIIGLYAFVLSVPVLILKKRMLPRDVNIWLRGFPISTKMELQASLIISLIFLLPLIVVFAISFAIWSYQAPKWFSLLAALGSTILSLSICFTICVTSLFLLCRSNITVTCSIRARPQPYCGKRARLLRSLTLFHHIFLLRSWRQPNRTAFYLGTILSLTLTSSLLWIFIKINPAELLCGIATSTLFLIMIDRADKYLRECSAVMTSTIKAWPINFSQIILLAQLFLFLTGAIIIFLIVFGKGVVLTRSGEFYLFTAFLCQLLLIFPKHISPRSRVGLIVLGICLLSSAGSEF